MRIPFRWDLKGKEGYSVLQYPILSIIKNVLRFELSAGDAVEKNNISIPR